MADRAAAEIERAALRYATRGWSVIPAEARGKRPIVAWQEFQRRQATPEEISAWFRRWPRANIAIVTGALSGLVVLDIDPRHGGIDSLAQLASTHGALPTTLEARTGGGGTHLYFAHPGGGVRNRVGLSPGIDLRGDGGCVIAPPSVHPSGRRYAWSSRGGPETCEPAPMPRWMRIEARDDPGHAGYPPSHWRELAHSGVPKGRRNDAIASFTGHLLWRGVDPAVALDLMLAWNRFRCTPPLPDSEVTRTVESIVRLHEREQDDAPAAAPAPAKRRSS